ncbi:GerMN domain-containing protein [Arthrobacter sp. Br18]|uniref:GerMN domain-containing protein n=1 Tax=Arthrobacter sp. Br18 TaxID=1312954 RepID=UPI0004AF475C|nr:GerMN domain-containing protein [Arthrobacter sp. Br18]
MGERNPLRESRLGLRNLLSSSGGVLLAGSLLLIPGCTGFGGGGSGTLSAPPSIPDAAGADLGSRTGSPTVPLQVSGTGGSAPSGVLPVYWLGRDGDTDTLLYREFTPAAAPDSSGDPIADAVRHMTVGEPLDGDFFSPWSSATRVSSSISTRNVITVDISSDAFGGQLEPGVARKAVQQLVFTATAAAANAGLIPGGEVSSVLVLVDGEAGYEAFGEVELGGEFQRDNSLVAPVWITNPQDGEVRDPSTVVINGSGRSDTATLSWRISAASEGDSPEGNNTGGNSTGETVKEGVTGLDSPAGTTGIYSFTVALPPGHYEISVFRLESDENGKQHQRFTDTKAIEIK